jgi:hypothetical protein
VLDDDMLRRLCSCGSSVSTTRPARRGTGHSKNSASLCGSMEIAGATHSRGLINDCRPIMAADTKHKSDPGILK